MPQSYSFREGERRIVPLTLFLQRRPKLAAVCSLLCTVCLLLALKMIHSTFWIDRDPVSSEEEKAKMVSLLIPQKSV